MECNKEKFHNVNFFISTETEFYIENENILNKIESFAKENNLELKAEEDKYQFELVVSKKNPLDVVIQTNLVQNFLSNATGVIFHPKFEQHKPGCSMQISVSIYINGINIYRKIDDKFPNTLTGSVGGLLKHIKPSMFIFCPKEESYNRFKFRPEDIERKHIHYPVNISWGINNRTTAIRIPIKGQNVTEYYIENRVPCIYADPILTVSTILWSMIDGMINNIEPSEKIYGNAHDEIYNFLEPLPKSLSKAKTFFNNSTLKKALLKAKLI